MNSHVNPLMVLERQLAPLAPRFEEALSGMMPVKRLMRTLMVSCERLPQLLDCNRQSLINAAMSAAVLGLEVDGVTGQAYLLPFAGKAQLVIGYKGFNTLAARSDITITGGVVREGDVFDFDLGEGWVTHKPTLGSKTRIVAAWAKASHLRRPAVVVVLGIEELMAVKAKSPGAKRNDSPWNDPMIGFPAMCEKTAKRRLARSLPLNTMQLAARMDEAVDEQGKSAWITPDRGTVIEGEMKTVGDIEPVPTPTAQELIGRRSTQETTIAPSEGEGPGGGSPGPSPATDEGPDLSTLLNQYDPELADAADKGVEPFKLYVDALPREIRAALKPEIVKTYLPRAREIDQGRVG